MQDAHSLTGCKGIKLPNLKRRTVEPLCETLVRTISSFYRYEINTNVSKFVFLTRHGGEDC